MKRIIELLICILHPLAVVLIWLTLPLKRNMSLVAKITWGIARSSRSCPSSMC